MNKQGILIGIALILFFTSVALATSTAASASSHVRLYSFIICHHKFT